MTLHWHFTLGIISINAICLYGKQDNPERITRPEWQHLVTEATKSNTSRKQPTMQVITAKQYLGHNKCLSSHLVCNLPSALHYQEFTGMQ